MLSITDLSLQYGFKHIFKNISAQIHDNDRIGLAGVNGTGKSTLLHVAGLLENPDSGTVLIGDKPGDDISDSDKTSLRRTEIGFVYQFHHLLPEFTALENPASLSGSR